MAGLKNIVGGELKGYTELLEEARKEAVSRMVELAKAMGANAVVNVRFSTSSVPPGRRILRLRHGRAPGVADVRSRRIFQSRGPGLRVRQGERSPALHLDPQPRTGFEAYGDHCNKTIDPAWNVVAASLVTGSTAVSVDYFKRVAATLRNLFGGSVSAYETLLDRARREAVLRMKEEARKLGATLIVNVRIETSSISGAKGNNKSIACVEVLASGTALKIR